MSIRKKLLLLLLSLASLATLVLAGCMGEMSAEEFLEKQGASNQCVTYYANGGTFNGSNSITVKTLYYHPDTYVINDFENVRNISIARTDYVFDGWYYVVLGSDGTPALDENGNITLSSTPVDFTKKIQENEKWYIGASWVADVRLEIKLVTSDGGKLTADNGTEYENGALLTTRSFPNGVAVMDTTAPVKCSGYSFVQFFHDKECTKRVTGNISLPEETDENPVIYAQYIKGSWTIVRTASDVRNMLFNPGGKDYWIATMTEEKVIDCSKISLNLRTGEFNAHIEGNGYTLKGIGVSVNKLDAGSAYSLFGQFTDKTTFRNITFEDLTITVSTAASASIFAICSSANGATLENLTFKNVGLNITTGSLVPNIPSVEGGYLADKWLFGADTTDAQFLASNTGVTLDGATLNMNKTEYIFGNN